MIEYYKTRNGLINKEDSFISGCWINITNPSISELRNISSRFNIDINTLSSALDKEERSRLESEDNYNMVIIDVPIDESDVNSFTYSTMPLSIVLVNDAIITISSIESEILNVFIKNKIKNFSTTKKSRFLFQILQQNAFCYLKYLRQIDNLTNQIERNIYSSVKNQELIQILNLEKSLIYFSTSLKANDMILNKIMRTKSIVKFEDDEDLLEDVLMDNKQALEMSNIYGDILSRVMDAFSSIISNNQNRVMSILTSVTLIMSIFTIISGFFGMNVLGLPFSTHPYGFFIIILISILIAIMASILIYCFNKRILK